MTEVDAVIAGQVARRLGRGDQIIRGHGVGTVRQRNLFDAGPQVFVTFRASRTALSISASSPSAKNSLGHADGERLDRVLQRGRVRRHGWSTLVLSRVSCPAMVSSNRAAPKTS